VFELLLVGALLVAGLFVVGLLVAVASVVGFAIVLPFKILGWTLKLVGLLIALPILLVGGLLAGGGVLLALLFGLLLPLAPVIGLAWLVWWLATRGDRRSHASVAS